MVFRRTGRGDEIPNGRHAGEISGMQRRFWTPENTAVRITRVNELLRPGDRMFIRCEGGPCLSRLEYFPPELERAERGGTYVLVDEGEPEDWLYLFVSNEY